MKGRSAWTAAIVVVAAAGAAVLALTHEATPASGSGACVRSQTQWLAAGAAWPGGELTLGDVAYARDEARAILGPEPRGDASLVLARELAAAKLNAARGANLAPVQADVEEADQLLASYGGRLPYKVEASSDNGELMLAIAQRLEAFNEGRFAPPCGDSPVPSPVLPPLPGGIGDGCPKGGSCSPDLRVRIAGRADGGLLAFEVTVTNAGRAEAKDVSLKVVLPDAASPWTLSKDRNGCEVDGSTATCGWDALKAGSAAQVGFTARWLPEACGT